jgi:hypothetical protein
MRVGFEIKYPKPAQSRFPADFNDFTRAFSRRSASLTRIWSVLSNGKPDVIGSSVGLVSTNAPRVPTNRGEKPASDDQYVM